MEADMNLNFQEISQQVQFRDLLERLEIGYEETDKELKGNFGQNRPFVITKAKNLFLCPYDDKVRGGVINFLSYFRKIGLKEAAAELVKMSAPPKEPKREIPELTLHYTPLLRARGITEELAKEYELGLVKQRSIMAKKIAIMIHDENGEKVGYIGWSKEGGWFFPKGYHHHYVYNMHRVKTDYAILVACPFEAFHLVSLGFPYTVALISSAVNLEQVFLLSRYKRVLLLFKEPGYIMSKLAKQSFVKAPQIENVADLTAEQVKSFF